MSESAPPWSVAVNKIFGDDLPQASSDEREDPPPHADEHYDGWLKENVPPHHG